MTEKQLPYSLARIARYIPDTVRQAARDFGELTGRPGDDPIVAALRQTSAAEFSEQEWGALLECHAVLARLQDRDEKIQINYRGPDIGELEAGANELRLDQWSEWFGIPVGYRALLFSLVRHLRPKTCLELGTAAGFSSLYMAQALALNGEGVLHTIEGDESSYEVGKETLWLVRDHSRTRLGLFDEILDELLPETPPLDLVFVDGAHTGEEEIGLAEHLSQHLGSGCVVVYNGIHWSDDMSAAWRVIRGRPEVAASLDLGKFGILQTKEGCNHSQAFHFAAASDRGLRPSGTMVSGITPENVTWIFGSPRSGTTWLRDIMRSARDSLIWEEPFVGDLFGNFYYERAQEGQLQAGTFIMGEPVRAAWVRGIRQFILEVSKGRFPEVDARREVIIKEPSGSIGAPLLLEAFPESRMALLVRDPRDVAASYLDASRKGAWLYERRSRGWIKESEYADRSPEAFIERIAEEYVQHVGNALKAYEAHPEGRKSLVRYEDLVADTPETMRRLYSDLGIKPDALNLEKVIEEHDWGNIPEEEKGEGKFYRKGSPGSWREDLTQEQARIVERIAGPLLKEFYPEEGSDEHA